MPKRFILDAEAAKRRKKKLTEDNPRPKNQSALVRILSLIYMVILYLLNIFLDPKNILGKALFY